MRSQIPKDVVESIRLAARKLSSYRRREYQAEMALKYYDGSSRKACLVGDALRWKRGLASGGQPIPLKGWRCLDNARARGRKKTEELCPELEKRVHEIVEPEAQADPKFQTALAQASSS